MDAGGVIGLALLALALAGIATLLLRRPRLALELSLRGSTRHGTLYVVLHNRGRTSARGLQVAATWLGDEGRRAGIEERALDDLAAGDAVRLEVSRLLSAVADDPRGWSAIEVRVRASNALPATARLALTRREAAGEAEPVKYARAAELRCPESPDGKHRWEPHRVENDGVVETWRACGRCRHVVREPLSAADEQKQRAVRAERAERLRREMEVEFARNAAREDAPRARRAPPPREEVDVGVDELPVAMAFVILELDPTKASWEDVLAAHRRLALAHHPDRRPDADKETRAALERRMQEINAARDRLRAHFEGPDE